MRMVEVVPTPRPQGMAHIAKLRSVLIAWIIAGHALLGPLALFVIGTFLLLPGSSPSRPWRARVRRASPRTASYGSGAVRRFAGLLWRLLTWFARTGPPVGVCPTGGRSCIGDRSSIQARPQHRSLVSGHPSTDS